MEPGKALKAPPPLPVEDEPLPELPPSGWGVEEEPISLPPEAQRRVARRQRRELALTLLRMLLDAAAGLGGFGAAYALRWEEDLLPRILPPPPSVWAEHALLFLLALWATFHGHGLYRVRRGTSRVDQTVRAASAASTAVLLTLAVGTLLLGDRFLFSPRILAYGWALTILADAALRGLLEGVLDVLRARGIERQRVLIVGSGPAARTILHQIRRTPSLGYQVLGLLSDRWPEEEAVDGFPVLGPPEAVAEKIREADADEVILALEPASYERILNLVLRCEDEGVQIRVYPDTFQIISKNEISVEDLQGLPLVVIRQTPLHGFNRFLKRALDLAISVPVLIFSSPLLLLIALLVKLEDGGPVFYVQERVGLDGRPIQMLKFRSMRVDAERETGPTWARPDDPRRTRIGRILRRFSLDELPQFINVLVGQMSVVGPRPERPVFVEQFRRTIPRYMRRHRVKAGLTGWAQVNGLRGDTSVEERTRYDLYYVENWSIWLDLRIILRTLVEIFREENAY